MTAQLYVMMIGWRDGGDDQQRRHAAYRLSLPDAIAFANGEGEIDIVPEVPLEVDPWLERILECPDYNPGCCSHPAPYCSRYLLSPPREMCIKCLSGIDVTAKDA